MYFCATANAYWEVRFADLTSDTPCVHTPALCTVTPPLSAADPTCACTSRVYVHPMCAPQLPLLPSNPPQSHPLSHILTSTSSSSHTSNHMQAISPTNPIKSHINQAMLPVS